MRRRSCVNCANFVAAAAQINMTHTHIHIHTHHTYILHILTFNFKRMLGNFFCAPKTNKQTERQKQSARQEVAGVEEKTMVEGVEKGEGEEGVL